MLSLGLRRSAPSHPGCALHWDAESAASELALAVQQLSSADVVIKPNELHLAFDIGPLHSKGYSRFKRLSPSLRPRRPAPSKSRTATLSKPPALSRSSTTSSTATLTMTLSADVGVLLTRHVRRESTYIVWGGLLAFEPPAARLPLRNVLVRIAVDDEGAEDLLDHARHYEGLAQRGLYVGYYGLFRDSIGSTALVVEDLGDESPSSSPSPSPSLRSGEESP
ncbi:hypothetical protein C8Q78DRAFT_1077240 [Trametes maxima]|nr:hypothetical protein C8Q78DRAFT_1077240 [Trametes maxima]